MSTCTTKPHLGGARVRGQTDAPGGALVDERLAPRASFDGALATLGRAAWVDGRAHLRTLLPEVVGSPLAHVAGEVEHAVGRRAARVAANGREQGKTVLPVGLDQRRGQQAERR